MSAAKQSEDPLTTDDLSEHVKDVIFFPQTWPAREGFNMSSRKILFLGQCPLFIRFKPHFHQGQYFSEFP